MHLRSNLLSIVCVILLGAFHCSLKYSAEATPTPTRTSTQPTTKIKPEDPAATEECRTLSSLAHDMNNTSPDSPIIKECLQNIHCNGINCRCRFKKIENDPMIPNTWLQPFCFGFYIMSCKAPLGVIVRITDNNVNNVNYTYEFQGSELLPIDKFGTHLQVVDVQLYVNVTFESDPRTRYATFGLDVAVRITSEAFGHYEQWPDWGKVQLVPVRKIRVAGCTAERNSTIGQDPCVLLPKLPDFQPTKPPQIELGNCSLSDLQSCGDQQMCIANPLYHVPAGANNGICICAFDAVYNPQSRSCSLHKPATASNIPATLSTPTTIKPTAGTIEQHSPQNLGVFIGLPIGGIIILIAIIAFGIFLYRKNKARYADHEILMQDDGLDALIDDDDDRPISL